MSANPYLSTPAQNPYLGWTPAQVAAQSAALAKNDPVAQAKQKQYSAYVQAQGSGYRNPTSPIITPPTTTTPASSATSTSGDPYGLTSPGTAGVAYQAVQPKELVGNQLEGLLSQRNPYIQQAIAQSEAQAAGRGLLNSSMAAGAGENAAIASAMPIANAQAQQYANVGMANQMASNQQLGAETAANAQVAAAGASASGQIGAASLYSQATEQGQKLQFQEAGQQLGLQYAQLGQQNTQFNSQLGQQSNQFNSQLGQNNSQFNAQLQQGNQQFGAGLNNQQQEFGANMAYNTNLQNAQMQQNANNMRFSSGMTMMQDQQAGFNNIMMNPNMDAAGRTSALNSLTQFGSNANSYVNTLIAGLQVPQLTMPIYWTSPTRP